MELRIEHLTKAYGKKVALKDFTATLSNGIYGLLTFESDINAY